MAALSEKQLNWIGCTLGLLYGVSARFVFGLGDTGRVFAVMSGSFIFGVPVVLGFITVWFGEYRRRYSWARRVLMPWLPSVLCLACCLALLWEGLLCVWLWLPLVLMLSSFGGLIAGLLRLVFRSDRSKTYCIAVVVLLPFAAAPVEALRRASVEIRTVKTAIEIDADADTVWRNIRSVPRIQESEQSFDFTHFLGFPRPVQAVLRGEGVGAVRRAEFERGVLFIEQITEWQPGQRLSFTVHADPATIPPTTFDEHVTIGGQYFDVLRGTYEIERLGSGRVRLHLSSEQRLSTRFNIYSHLWTEALMADLQTYILRIIKVRCEHSTRPSVPRGAVGLRGRSEVAEASDVVLLGELNKASTNRGT